MYRTHCSTFGCFISAFAFVIAAVVMPTPANAQTTSKRNHRHDSTRALTSASTRSDSTHEAGHVAARADAIDVATQEYREHGVARSVAVGNAVAFPYGHSDPVLTCTVLRVCVVELEDGEEIVNEPIAGDQARWIIEPAHMGPSGRNTLVVVKPKACDITTNLVIPTDRRIYDLTLDSPPCKEHSTNPQRSYVRDIRFYYPDEDASGQSGAVGNATAGVAGPVTGGPPYGSLRVASVSMQAAARPSNTSAPLSFFDRADLNHSYRVKRERRGPFGMFGQKPLDFPWKPTAIVDDGAHLYVKLPLEARSHAAPVLYALEDDGSRTMVNYAVREADGMPAYVTDRSFRRGVFVVMSGTKEQRLEFENRAWGKSRVPSPVRKAVANGTAGRESPSGGTNGGTK